MHATTHAHTTTRNATDVEIRIKYVLLRINTPQHLLLHLLSCMRTYPAPRGLPAAFVIAARARAHSGGLAGVPVHEGYTRAGLCVAVAKPSAHVAP